VDGTALADETRSKALEHAVALHEHAPEPVDGLSVVGAMHLVPLERNRIGNFVRLCMDPDVHAETMQRLHDLAVKRGNGLGLECDACDPAVAGRHDEHVIDEIEIDLKGLEPVRNWRRRQAPAGEVERAVPPVVDGSALAQADLADDLRPHVQRRARIGPRLERQWRPRFGS